MSKQFYSVSDLVNLSDSEIDKLADAGHLSVGQIVEAKMEKQLRGQRQAALQQMLDADRDITPEMAERESYSQRIVRLSRHLLDG